MTDDIKIEDASSSTAKESFKFKVVVVGDSSVGKSNLIKRFVNNTFSSDTKATVGVEFLSKNFIINGEVYKIEIWDTAGQERYKSITAAYYKGAKGAMIIYDVTNKTSFDNVDKWRNEIKERGAKGINLMIIGNKIDLKDKIQITSAMATDKAKTFEIPVMETSALDATNVQQAFHDLIKQMYKSTKNMIKKEEAKQQEKMKEGNSVKLDTVKDKKKKGCC